MANDERRSPLKARGASGNTLLAMIACGLLLLNIVVGGMVHRALSSEAHAQTEEIIVSPGD